MTLKRTFDQPITRSRVPIQAAMICAAIVSATTSLLADPSLNGILGALLALVMASIAFVDARWPIIPNELNAAALVLALSHVAIQNPGAALEALAAATLRGGALAMFFLGLRLAYRHLRGREGIGLGDVKLAGVAGAWLDWTTIPIAI